MVSFPDPHHPFNPPGRYWDAYRPEDMPVPAAFERNDWTPPPHVAALHREREEGEAALRGMNSIGCTLQEALEARALTCGMIEKIDAAVARLLAALDRSGGAGSTVVAFTSDHGDHLGDHGLLLKGAEPYREITRVPLIWPDPRDRRRNGKDGIGKKTLGHPGRPPHRTVRDGRSRHATAAASPGLPATQRRSSTTPAAPSRPRRPAAGAYAVDALAVSVFEGQTGATLRPRSRPGRAPQPLDDPAAAGQGRMSERLSGKKSPP